MRFSFTASYIAIWILVLFQGLLVLALLRQLTELRRLIEAGGLQADDRLPVGSPAPEFSGVDLRSGEQVRMDSLSWFGGVMLFLSPDCGVCKGLAEGLRQPATDGLPRIVVFCQGEEQACSRFVKRLDPEVHLLVKGAKKTAALYHVSGFPTAIAVDRKQRIVGYGHPENVGDLKDFWARSLKTDSADAVVEEKAFLASVSQ